MAFTIPKNIENNPKWWHIKYDSIFMLFFLLLIILWPIYWTNFVEIRNLKIEIQELKLLNKANEVNEKYEQIFAQRINNLESKYIDVVASKDSINFWMTFLLFVFTVWIWWTWWSKRNFEKTAKEELKEISDAKEKVLEKISNIEKIADEKIAEFSNKAANETKQIIEEGEKQRKILDYLNDFKKYLDNDENEKALHICDCIIKIDKDNYRWYVNKWVIFMRKQEYLKAFEFYTKALWLANNTPWIYYSRWLALEAMWRIQEAVLEYIQELNIEWNIFSDKQLRQDIYVNKTYNGIRKTKEFKDFEKKLKKTYWDK